MTMAVKVKINNRWLIRVRALSEGADASWQFWFSQPKIRKQNKVEVYLFSSMSLRDSSIRIGHSSSQVSCLSWQWAHPGSLLLHYWWGETWITRLYRGIGKAMRELWNFWRRWSRISKCTVVFILMWGGVYFSPIICLLCISISQGIGCILSAIIPDQQCTIIRLTHHVQCRIHILFLLNINYSLVTMNNGNSSPANLDVTIANKSLLIHRRTLDKLKFKEYSPQLDRPPEW